MKEVTMTGPASAGPVVQVRSVRRLPTQTHARDSDTKKHQRGWFRCRDDLASDLATAICRGVEIDIASARENIIQLSSQRRIVSFRRIPRSREHPADTADEWCHDERRANGVVERRSEEAP